MQLAAGVFGSELEAFCDGENFGSARRIGELALLYRQRPSVAKPQPIWSLSTPVETNDLDVGKIRLPVARQAMRSIAERSIWLIAVVLSRNSSAALMTTKAGLVMRS